MIPTFVAALIDKKFPKCSECGLQRNGAYLFNKPICFVCWPPENDSGTILPDGNNKNDGDNGK